MDLTRFFLYSALAFISYLMLLAWQEDYPPVVDNGQQFVAAQNGNVASDLPVAQAPAANEPNNDLPQAQSAPDTTAQASTLPATPLNTSDTVEINTDTLSVQIDLNGGDITYLALPQYLRELEGAGDPFVLLSNNPGRSYVAQSGLIGTNGIDNPARAQYRAAQSSYQLDPNEDTLIVDLQAVTSDGVNITKRYTFQRDSYLIDITYIVDNQTADLWQANVFGQIKRDPFDDPSDAGGFANTYLGFVTTDVDDPYIKVEFDDIDSGVSNHDMEGGWIGFSQHYFISAWVPGTDTVNRFSLRRNNSNQYFGGFTSSALTVEPGETASQTIQYFAGPKDQYVLAEVSPNLELTIDYGFLWFLAAPMYWVLRQINSLVINWGLSIILLTVLVKAVFYKLSETQYRSMAGMRKMMPKMQQLKESYGDDKMKLQKATMELYKKEKINPFGGCLPMLVQMPVFIALYWVLMESVELRHAPFMLWLTDLSVRDPFFILPLLMGATMYLQTSLSPAPADPMQAKVMKFMPIAMTVLFLWFPAGLVLYWLTNGLLGILQQWYITRKIENEAEAKKG
jgi:YidC/Oxa1 family membrane protein insertase